MSYQQVTAILVLDAVVALGAYILDENGIAIVCTTSAVIGFVLLVVLKHLKPN